MATQGPFVWLDRVLLKLANGTMNISSDTFHAVLTTSSQALTATFTGTSGDARYADLTAELTTANGYTSGGVALSGVSLARGAANVVIFTSTGPQWTLSGTITCKYMAIVDWTTANKDLIGYCDFDTGGGSISPTTPLFGVAPDPTNGWGYYSQ